MLTGNEYVSNATACVRSEQRKVFNDAAVKQFLGLSYGNHDADWAARRTDQRSIAANWGVHTKDRRTG